MVSFFQVIAKLTKKVLRRPECLQRVNMVTLPSVLGVFLEPKKVFSAHSLEVISTPDSIMQTLAQSIRALR